MSDIARMSSAVPDTQCIPKNARVPNMAAVDVNFMMEVMNAGWRQEINAETDGRQERTARRRPCQL